MNQARADLKTLCQPYGFELHRLAQNQLHFLVQESQAMLDLADRLEAQAYALVTLAANDERDLEDHCFKLYYLFSHPYEDLFLVIENNLLPNTEVYPSIWRRYPAVLPFEAEIASLFGLHPDLRLPSPPGKKWRQEPEEERHPTPSGPLHARYPPDLHPLRRGLGDSQLAQALAEDPPAAQTIGSLAPPEGESYLPVGPVHAGIIEPGHFLFRTGGETIKALDIHLGYTHKGIERLFQAHASLESGWRIAECIAGDSSFAHSLAYCLAAEALAQVPASPDANRLRAIFLELERIANHIGDSSALAQDTALEVIAGEMAVLREDIQRLNQRLTGSRFLRGVNRPGGVALPHALDAQDLLESVQHTAAQYQNLARILAESNDFRERSIQVGVLRKETALALGVTGLAARASGLRRDFRLQHPFDPYNTPHIRALLFKYQPERRPPQPESQEGQAALNASLPLWQQQRLEGDIIARFLVRAREVSLAAELIAAWLENWTPPSPLDLPNPIDFSHVPNFEFSLGCVEGWRGDIVYWLMKDKFENIYRCKVRDPSTLNWPGLKAAVEPHLVNGQRLETALADFPLINKSFNLSYSGNDL